MDLFGRKKKKEEEELALLEAEEQEEEQLKLDRENRKLKKKLKDLAPENSGKRKEPIKPWGKKERLIVGGFFVATTLTAAILFLQSHDNKFPGLPQIKFNEVNFKNPFGEKVIELGQKKSVSNEDSNGGEIVSKFNKDTMALSGVYGFSVIRLWDGGSFDVAGDEEFQGASMIKVPLMVYAYTLSERGELNLEDEYKLREADKVPGAGVLYGEPAGTEYSYRQLLEFMGKNSDRTAYAVMKKIVGEEGLMLFVKDIGLNNTDINTGLTTPNDMAKLFQKLYSDDLLGGDNKDELLSFLSGTDFENLIPAGIPEDVQVFHKIGQDEKVLADGGIVNSETPYVLVIMSKGITRSEALDFFPKFSKYIYEIENGVQ